MNRYFHMHHNRSEYPDLRRLQDHNDVRMLHSPASGISMLSKRELQPPIFEDRDEQESRTEELEREKDHENGVIILKKLDKPSNDDQTSDNEDSEIRDESESNDKDNDEEKDTKEEDKNAETFVAVIAQSILSVPTKRMTLSSIYNYIASHYPHFDKEKGPGWRNSVRHNLSSNDCFVKASRAENGKGHYWMVHPKDLPEFSKGNFRRRRKPRRSKCSHSLMFRDGPLYYHSYGLGYSPYSYSSLRTAHELTDFAYGAPSSERALANSYRSRIGLLSSCEDTSNRYGFALHPYSTCPSSLAFRYPGDVLRSSSGGLTNIGSSFHPVNHFPCSCHRCEIAQKEGHYLCS